MSNQAFTLMTPRVFIPFGDLISAKDWLAIYGNKCIDCQIYGVVSVVHCQRISRKVDKTARLKY